MDFGIFDHLDRRNEPIKQTYDERLAMVSAAEAAGFCGYLLAEHHGTPLGMAPSPGLFLAAGGGPQYPTINSPLLGLTTWPVIMSDSVEASQATA